MSTIQFQQVSKRYPDGTEAVSDISLEVGDGEFLVLVGPSGCGKSTALRMTAGLEAISSGDLLIDGERVNDRPPKERDIAMVFQDYALYPQMSVRQNMGFALKLAKLKKAEIARKVEEAADVLSLTEHLDRKPGQLSGGQRQRVAMGRAIVRDPKAFLMDEPLSNLDAKLRWEMRAQIARLQERLGTTTIFVTHDQTEAMTLGDRIALMRQGVVQQVGPPRELYCQPANLFVADFIGSPPMNLLPAAIDDGRLRTDLGDVELDREQLAAISRAEPHSLVCGIRAEELEEAALVHGDKVAGGQTLRARVELLELLGGETYAYLALEQASLPEDVTRRALEGLAAHGARSGRRGVVVARLGPEPEVSHGDSVELWFSPRSLFLFDAETGAALRP